MSAAKDYPFERWPGYNEQSWAERFAEIDRINQQRHEQHMVLIKLRTAEQYSTTVAAG